MSTPVQPENNTPATQGSTSPTSGLPSGTNTGSGQPSTPPVEFRYSDTQDVPVWARGKTAAEVLNISNNLYNQVERYIQAPAPVQQPQYQQPPQQQYQQPTYQQAPQSQSYDPEAPLTMGAFQQLAQQFQQSQQADVQRAIEISASNALENIKREYADDFAKWGHEIYGSLGGIKKADWTVENLRKVVRFVRADHVDEIARAQAERLVAERPGSEVLRSTGGSVPVSGAQPNADLTLKSERLPAEYRERLAQVGLTEAGLNEFCAANGMTRDQFFAQFGKTAITEQYTQRG